MFIYPCCHPPPPSLSLPPSAGSSTLWEQNKSLLTCKGPNSREWAQRALPSHPPQCLALYPYEAQRLNEDLRFWDRFMFQILTSVLKFCSPLCFGNESIWNQLCSSGSTSKEPLQPWLDNQNPGPLYYLQRQVGLSFPLWSLIVLISYLLFAALLLWNDLLIWLIFRGGRVIFKRLLKGQ